MGAARACEDHMAMEEMLKNKEIVLVFGFGFWRGLCRSVESFCRTFVSV